MSDTLDILRQIALQVRNASAPAENTAERVGRVLVGILENLSQTDIEELKAMFLRKDQPDMASKVITFIEGLISQGLIEAKGGIKLPSGAALYSAYVDGTLAFAMDENGFVIYEKGTANKWSIITSNGAEFQNLVIKFLAQITDLEVSNKATTLDLLVRRLADTYNLTVSNVATLFRTIIKDYVSSEAFIPGLTGEGFKLYKAISGDWNLELDNLTIRKAMTVFELIISKVRAVNGGLVVSPANGRVKSVSEDSTNYVLGIEGDMTFVADDLVRCQVFSPSGAKYYWVRVVSVSGDSITIPKSEFPVGTVPAVGDDLVQMGNKTNTARQGILYLTASEDGKPRFSVLDGVNSTDLTGKNKLILGCLDGITDSDFPSDAQPSGYGLWAVNVFLKGLFILRNGKSVEDELNDQITAVQTAFEIREGQISSKVTQATTAATQASGYATSAQGSASTANTKASEAAGSASTATAKATAASNSANAAAGSATAAQDAADDAATILSQVSTKESSINQTASNITLQVSEVTTKVATATNAANTATTKAGEASTSATNAANSANQASNILTTVTSKETSINQTAESIELKAVRAESAAGRAESVEASINLKADGIVLQASSQAAQSAVNGVQIGGRNLILNSAEYWFEYSDFSSATICEQNKITVISDSQFNAYKTWMPIAPIGSLLNKTFTYSIDVKINQDAPNAYAWFNVRMATGSTEHSVHASRYLNDILINEWVRIYMSLSVTDGYLGDGVGLCGFAGVGNNGLVIEYRNQKLEEGNKATAYTEAPEDVEADAQAKATAAQVAAQQYAENYANNNFTAKTTYNADLTVLSNQINSKVSRTDFDALGLRVSSAETSISQQAGQIALKASQSDLTVLGDRVSSAEQKITSDAIISTVSSTITTAKNEAINAAAADATTKADAAKSSAVSTAATDATTKANTAESNAKTYSNNTFTPITTYNTKIAQLENSISLKADSTTVNGINSRLSSAEAQITPDAINLTVKSQITTAVNDVQIGGRNLILNSADYWFDGSDFMSNVSLSKGEVRVLGKGGFNCYKTWLPLSITPSAGDTLTFSIDVLTDGNYYHNTSLFFNFRVGSTYYANEEVILPNIYRYIRYGVTVQIPADAPSGLIGLVGFGGTNGVDGHGLIIRYRNLQCEVGNKFSDWTPAPEDVDASIALRPTTEEIKSQFTIDSSGISILGKTIALTGLVTFSSLASDAQNKINTAQSTAESALTNAGTANLSIGTLQNNLGQMAYQNMVSLAKLDSTIVEGGYFKTSLIDANTIITGSLLATKIAATDITTTRLTVSEGCTVGGFAIGNGRIGSIASATGDGGELAIYSNFFRVGGSDGYVMLGNNVIPATAGGAFNATGRIVNQTVNQGAYWGYDACNTGLYISVSGGTKNFGIDSNAALKAPAFINTRVKYLVFGTTYSIDLSQYSIFMCYAASAKSVTMPDEASIAKQFSLSSLPSDFGCVFTFTVIGGSSDITLNNVIDWNMSSINLRLVQGDAVQLLVTKFPNFHYKIINHTD